MDRIYLIHIEAYDMGIKFSLHTLLAIAKALEHGPNVYWNFIKKPPLKRWLF